MQLTLIVYLALPMLISARDIQMFRMSRRADFSLANGQDAIAQNAKFQTLNASSPCQNGQNACIDNKFAQCVNKKFTLTACGPGTICAALPLVNSRGTSVTCTTQADLDARTAATGAKASSSSAAPSTTGIKSAPPPPSAPSANTGANNDPQTSLTVNPGVIAKGFANNGQDKPEAGQVASLTSTNNFINFCLTTNLPITNGQQITTGSCNPAPMGAIPAQTNMPSSKFVFPKNGDKVTANQAFTVQMAINNLETGNFVNAAQNYFSAPQQLNAQGIIRGHSHIVIEKLQSLQQTTPLNPTGFSYFKGLNAAAVNGILTANVDKGLPAGVYKISSINTAANHQPVLVPVAQHGSLDDAVYFTIA